MAFWNKLWSTEKIKLQRDSLAVFYEGDGWDKQETNKKRDYCLNCTLVWKAYLFYTRKLCFAFRSQTSNNKSGNSLHCRKYLCFIFYSILKHTLSKSIYNVSYEGLTQIFQTYTMIKIFSWLFSFSCWFLWYTNHVMQT